LGDADPAVRPRRRDLVELYRLMTKSVGDLLDEWFDDDAVKGAYASTGVVECGQAQGPRAPPTTCILGEPPRYEAATPEERERLLRTDIALRPSIEYLERAWQDAVRGEPATGPYVEIEVLTTIDPTLTDDGTTVMTLFTQYGPHREEDWGDGAREAGSPGTPRRPAGSTSAAPARIPAAV
jgi:phytoene dehydrogenase-like protein